MIDTPYDFEDVLKKLIIGTIGKINLFNAYSIMGKYELTTIFPDQIIALLAPSASHVLKEEE